MNIISIIDKRATPNSIDQKFDVLANEMIKYAAAHQKRVVHILPEFDLHDEIHSKAVEENIAQLIGEKRLHRMSTTELFMLCMAAHLHDIGMAPSDGELKVMSLTEGFENQYECENSIKWDGKKPYSFVDAKRFIEKQKDIVCGFNDNKENKFAPASDARVIERLANLLIDYQEFRNGYVDQLREVKDKDGYIRLSKSIRQEYIRCCHHVKSAEYIMNLQPEFENALGEVWPKGLVEDLSSVCKAHGEGDDFIKRLDKEKRYFGQDSVNLQFVAEMLRLGDIIHFCADRAPIALRSSIIFNSRFSYKQWVAKAGLYYTICDGFVSYTAYCLTPEVFYLLQEYCDWIDDEICYYDTLKLHWIEKYCFEIGLIRKHIDFDSNKFRPVIGKKIVLNQSKILELLMGVQLYKDPYACLRELYQNSLDACRCRIDVEKSRGSQILGQIEFGLGTTKNGEKYLYCLDNGIGMTEDIIEKYLLTIGNSYYGSKDFHRNQSKWDSSFTPVSQFGMGILSCFMIADRVEVVTRYIDKPTGCISCCLEGTKEYFYYKTPEEEDSERIIGAGTFVKLILKPYYGDALISGPIEKLGIMMAVKRKQPYTGVDEKYNQYFDKWERHIYYHLNKFITKVPDGITLKVRIDSKNTIDYVEKPFVIKYGEHDVSVDDDSFLRYYGDKNAKRYNLFENYNHDQLKDYPICLSKNGIEYDTIVSLPLTANTERIKRRLVNGSCYAVDGIIAHFHIDRTISSNAIPLYMERIGSINFVSIQRPKLSVDRESITEMPSDYEKNISLLAIELLKNVLAILNEHIHCVGDSEIADEACEHVFDVLFGTTDLPFNAPLYKLFFIHSELFQNIDIVYHPLSCFVGDEITLGQFIFEKTVRIKNYFFHAFLPELLRKLIVSKLLISSKVGKEKEKLIIESDNSNYTMEDGSGYLLLEGDDISELFSEYDYVSSFFPFVSNRMSKIVKKRKNERIASLSSYSEWDIDKFDSWFRLAKLDRIHMPLDNLSGYLCRLSKRYMLLLFLVPLSIELYDESYNEEFIKRGCTVLLTGDINDRSRRLPGKRSRQEMIQQLGDAFWEQNKNVDFFFLDDTPINRQV